MAERGRAVVEARDLSIGWSRDAVLLEHATFRVEAGEIFAILGGSGSGKSTLLHTLIGLEPALAGEVWIEGERRTDVPTGRPSFGVLFQSAALFGSLTVADNVALPLREWTHLPPSVISDMVYAKLRVVGLEGAERKLPAELSGGMRKRAGIARAMILEPELVFLDEPTAGLDPVTSADIDALVAELNRVIGITVLMVTHELASIRRLATRCLMIDSRSHSIVAEGSPEELERSTVPCVADFFHPNSRAA